MKHSGCRWSKLSEFFILRVILFYYVTYYSARVGVRSIVINPSVCLCVCLSVREHISGTAGPIGTKFSVQIPCGRGSVLLRRRSATLCTSGFMDDVTFGRNGRETDKGRQHSASANNYARDQAESDVYECLLFIVIINPFNDSCSKLLLFEWSMCLTGVTRHF